MKKLSIAALALFVSMQVVYAELPLGEKPAAITLSGEMGSRVDGTPWSSSELQNKVYVLVFADPDEADLNNTATEALKAEDFPDSVYASVAVINMAATWLPNMAINMKLKSKQEQYPSTVYVRDYEKTLVKKWKLADDSNDIVVFDKSGTVLFSRDGQLSAEDIATMIKVIRENL